MKAGPEAHEVLSSGIIRPFRWRYRAGTSDCCSQTSANQSSTDWVSILIMDTSFCNSTLHGVPQGCVVRPHLLTPLTHDCTATELHSANYIIKFRDDNIVVVEVSGDNGDDCWLQEELCQPNGSATETKRKVSESEHGRWPHTGTTPKQFSSVSTFCEGRKGQPSSCYSYHILPEDSWAHPLLIRQCIMWELQQLNQSLSSIL